MQEARSICAAPQLQAIPTGIQRRLGASCLHKIRTSQFLVTQASTTHLRSEIDGIKQDNSNRMFILGMGYVGQFCAQQLKHEGWDVTGTCTSIKKKKELERNGLNAHVFNACQPEWKILDVLRYYTHLLISIPPVEGIGDPMLQHEEYLKTQLVDGNLQWLCYLSSTGVYGDYKGAWVDEDYSPKPSNNLGKMRLNAEEGWLSLGQDLSLSTYVFRLGGIYGPGRSAIDTILKKIPWSISQQKRAIRHFTSRVHVADICQALRASTSMQVPRKIYNIVDDDPASREEVFAFAQELIERKWPGLIDPNGFYVDNTLPRKGHAEEKRVSNAHIKKELGVKLLYPSYRSGLQSIIDHHMENPGVNNC